MQVLRDIFKKFDTDGSEEIDGNVSHKLLNFHYSTLSSFHEEFFNAWLSLNLPGNQNEISTKFAEIDTSGDGLISWEEFRTAMLQELSVKLKNFCWKISSMRARNRLGRLLRALLKTWPTTREYRRSTTLKEL